MQAAEQCNAAQERLQELLSDVTAAQHERERKQQACEGLQKELAGLQQVTQGILHIWLVAASPIHAHQLGQSKAVCFGFSRAHRSYSHIAGSYP